MPTAADNLRSIKTFPDLVRYLEDALDWPLQEYGFDELTFEYSPAELGLKDEDAARVRAIHQLRPMVARQPGAAAGGGATERPADRAGGGHHAHADRRERGRG